MNSLKILFVTLSLFIFSACAQSSSIFPSVVTSLSEDAVVLPSPTSLVLDPTNSQIVVANSNVDVFFNQGSLAVLSLDTSTPTSPKLSASQIIATPNYAGELLYDGAGNLYVPYREESSSNSDVDQIEYYTLTSGDLALAGSNTVSPNPFGMATDGTSLFVVSDDVISLFDASLNLTTTIDLTTAEDAEIVNTDASFVRSAVYEAGTNQLFVSNENGKIFVVDLTNNALTHVIDGPTSTRNLVLSGTTLYALDVVTESVWVFETSLLPANPATPGEVDDAPFLLTTISVGSNPNGMAIDVANNRLYVGNTDDDTISVIDTLTNLELTRVSVGDDDSTSTTRDGHQPFDIAVAPFSGRTYVFVAGFGANSIVIIDALTLNVVEIFPDNSLNL